MRGITFEAVVRAAQGLRIVNKLRENTKLVSALQADETCDHDEIDVFVCSKDCFIGVLPHEYISDITSTL